VKIAVVGSTGSGKTSLARALAAGLAIPCVELDGLFWERGWTEAPDDVFRRRVDEALSGEDWVSDGNYSRIGDLTLGRANLVVWLDYPFRVVARQLLWRTIRRSMRREELWSGNRESIAMSFFSRKSILLWLLLSYRSNRRRYRALIESKEYPNLQIMHLRSPGGTRA
jgi:adenylate kinase family enzyme